MKTMQRIIPAILMVAFLAGCSSGCKNTRQLDPAGPYGDNKLLWEAHGVIENVNDIYDDVEGVAARNPAVVQSNSAIQKLVAKVAKERDGNPEPDELLANLLRASNAYERAQYATNATALEKELKIGREFLKEARVLLLLMPPPTVNTNAP